MKTLTALTCALAASLSLLADFPQLPLPIPCGNILSFEKTSAPQVFVDFDKAVEAERANPDRDFPHDLVSRKSPDVATVYAVFTVQVLPGRTISKHDFVLENDRGIRTPCLDMGLDGSGFYDFRLKTQTGPQTLRLIFSCPSDSYEVRLKSAFPDIVLPPIGDFKLNARPQPLAVPQDTSQN